MLWLGRRNLLRYSLNFEFKMWLSSGPINHRIFRETGLHVRLESTEENGGQ